MIKNILLLIFVLFFSCAGGLQNSEPDYYFEVDIPEGWRKLDTNKFFLITKDGAFLQYALIQQRPLDRSFKHTRKKLKKEMLPQEAAGVIIDEIMSDKNILNFKLIQNIPAVIQGNKGFTIVFSYRDQDGSALKTLYYGFIRDNYFYNLRYTAVKKLYFDRDFETFQKFVASFRFVK
jgi:hypothetical protein